MEENNHKNGQGGHRKTSVRVSKQVKDYTSKTCERLAGMSYGKLFVMLSKHKGVISNQDQQTIALARKLTKMIPKFIPVLAMFATVKADMQKFNKNWEKHVNASIDQLQTGTSPVYLRNKVSEILHARGYRANCTNFQLEWYLYNHPDDIIDPEKVADALLEYNGTDWKNLRHPGKDDSYTLKTKYCKLKSTDDMKAVIEFIYDIPSSAADDFRLKVENDIRVLEEFDKWWRSQNSFTTKFWNEYEAARRQLQTIPEAMSAGTEDNTDKDNKTVMSQDTDSQHAIVHQEDHKPEILPASEPSGDTTQRNYEEIISYLRKKAGSDPIGLQSITQRDQIIRDFASLSDFQTQMTVLRQYCDSRPYVTSSYAKMREILGTSPAGEVKSNHEIENYQDIDHEGYRGDPQKSYI